MPRQQAVKALRPLTGGEGADRAAIDYDAHYRALDLEPGAPPREIADRARLLRAVFDAEGLPPELRREAAARAEIVARAAETLTRYWHANSVPPPSILHPAPLAADPLAASAGLLAALAEALGANGADAAAAPIGEPPASPLPAAPAQVAVLHPQRLDQTAPPAPRRARPVYRGQPLPVRGGVAGEPPRRATRANPSPVAAREPPKPRPRATARSLALKLAMVGLVAVAVIRVLEYRASHPTLAFSMPPDPAVAAGAAGDPSARWPGLSSFQPLTGAAAPAVEARQR